MAKNRFEDKIIEVCDKCFCASCWYGEFMCDRSVEAGTVKKTVKELRDLEPDEDEHYWKSEKMREVYGDSAPFGYSKN